MNTVNNYTEIKVFLDYVRPDRYLSVVNVRMHEDYKAGNGSNDLALLKLNESVETGRLLALCEHSYEKETLALCGVGYTDSSLPILPPTMREVIVQQRLGMECPDFLGDYDDEVICVTSHGLTKGACKGDSGGPMYPLVDDTPVCLYGVVTAGPCRWQTYLMRVTAYLQWIRNHIK